MTITYFIAFVIIGTAPVPYVIYVSTSKLRHIFAKIKIIIFCDSTYYLRFFQQRFHPTHQIASFLP